jgi:tetratricopeptide (TPR) repeat protein
MVLTGCTRDPLIPDSLSRDKNVRELLELALEPKAEPGERFAALEPLIARYRESDETDELTLLLWRVLENNPNDAYGAYYLMALAEGARDEGSVTVAMDYWRRLIRGYPDLVIRDQSLHLLAMRELTRETPDPREAVALYGEMLRRFPDRIDIGRTRYALAKAYEEIGDWNSAFAEYRAFLDIPETRIPGEPDAAERIRKSLAFHASDKTWAVEDLETLVDTIKYAIRTRDARLLNRFRAQDFFLMNWSQETSDSFTHIPMNLGAFLKSSVGYRADLEPYSNDREAYLRTWGWSYRIRTWYLYFRKIDYPANPDVNGRWEWAGIYFGERL